MSKLRLNWLLKHVLFLQILFCVRCAPLYREVSADISTSSVRSSLRDESCRECLVRCPSPIHRVGVFPARVRRERDREC